MANFNKVILAGNLTRDPELRFTPKGMAICKFGLAINRAWTNETGEKKEEVTFVDVDAFGRQAETIAQYLKRATHPCRRPLRWISGMTSKPAKRTNSVSWLKDSIVGGSRSDTTGVPTSIQTNAAAAPSSAPRRPRRRRCPEDDVPLTRIAPPACTVLHYS
jgi:primosomal replication protein N